MRKFVLRCISFAALPMWAADAAAKGRRQLPPNPGRNHPEICRQRSRIRQGAQELHLPPDRENAGARSGRADRRQVGDGRRTSFSRPTASAPRRWSARPVVTLRNMLLTPADEQDLRDVQPFVLTTKEIAEYDIQYLGKQNADEIPCYVFAVKPKKMEQGKRYFEGQIWVDDRDFQIVKTYGKGVGVAPGRRTVPAVRDVSRADRRQVLVPHLHPRRRHAALQGHEPARQDDGEVRELQEVRRPVDHQVRRRGGREQEAARHQEARREKVSEALSVRIPRSGIGVCGPCPFPTPPPRTPSHCPDSIGGPSGPPPTAAASRVRLSAAFERQGDLPALRRRAAKRHHDLEPL